MADPKLSEELKTELIGNLGFCGCGNQEIAAGFLRDGLQFIMDQRKGPHYTRNAARFDPEFEKWCEDHSKAEVALFGSRGGAMLFYYWVDDRGLTEHGGSVPGWLTPEGEDLLVKLGGQVVPLP